MWQVTWCNCGSAMNFKQHCVQVVFWGRPNAGDEFTMEFLSCLLSPVSWHCYEYYVCSAIKCSFGKKWCAGFSRSLVSLEGRGCNILKKTHWAWFRISNHMWSAPKWLEIEAAVTGTNTATFWFILLSCRNFGAESEVCFLACTPLSWMLQAVECWFSALLGKFSPTVSHRTVGNLQILRNAGEACSKDPYIRNPGAIVVACATLWACFICFVLFI